MFLPRDCLEKLTCSVCNRLLSVFPIYIKKNDQQLSVCGRCQISDKENYLRCEIYETLASKLLFPCINKTRGCMEDLLPGDVKQHELICEYRKIRCFVDRANTCNFDGHHKNWLEHCEKKHSDLIDQQLEIDINKYQELLNILKYEGEVFLFRLSYDHKSKQLQCSVNVLGFGDKTKTYQIKINLETTNTMIISKFPMITVTECDRASIDVNIETLERIANIVTCTFTICDNNLADRQNCRRSVNYQRFMQAGKVINNFAGPGIDLYGTTNSKPIYGRSFETSRDKQKNGCTSITVNQLSLCNHRSIYRPDKNKCPFKNFNNEKLIQNDNLIYL